MDKAERDKLDAAVATWCWPNWGGGMLSGPEILRQMELGKIRIDPFVPVLDGEHQNVNSNSVNLRLGHELFRYDEVALSTRKKPRKIAVEFPPDEGAVLRPHRGFLARTLEKVYSEGFAPIIAARSGCGRLFLSVHQDAGFGDDGFDGTWTLELMANDLPVTIYPGDMLVQMAFFPVIGERKPYRGGYQGQVQPTESLISTSVKPAA